ncbi:hypothetical protein EG329_001296 [Mollisiaceae sp. DMI_Dod_QoI]|nr:hypothetical protein EG329_001296 [Helotiales sp. DMI_Dod_QoI]
MRLLDTSTLELQDFGSEVPPQYAILSHTWGVEEVTFDEIGTEEGKSKIGYQKIVDCCEQARFDHYEYVWIDTCCIDKKSSSELSEAINRMYSYYKDADICYAYLCDVLEDGCFPPDEFAASRWFRRGWTLQELVAPREVVFFDQEWTEIGTRASLKNELEEITTIDKLFLEHPDAVFSASVAQRMSWASKRETTREEDIAYCLLGIFNVHMPLLYGEGDKAFMRLQLELLALSNEQTIFAWTPDIGGELPTVPTLVRTNSSGEPQNKLNLLACSPAPFANCGDVRHYERILAAVYEWSSTTVFVLNYLAIVPLARCLSFTTKALSSKVEQLLGRDAGMLVDATFGNAVLVVSIIALSNGHIRIVQSTLLGSILSNILLVIKTLFEFTNLPLLTLAFNSTSASTMSSLVAVTLASIIIPATLYAILHASSPDTGTHILFLSRGAAILLLIVYMVYLYFQLKFGANFLDIERGPDSSEPEENRSHGFLDENPIHAFLALLSVTLVMTTNAIYFVESIEPVASSSHISRLFIGFILIPMVGMAADPAHAFNIAYHNRIDLAINIAIRRSVQIALFVTPFMVILGWAMNKAMTLHFQGFETVVFFLSLCEVSYLVQDGKSKHLASAICIGTYVIIALTFYVYPDDEPGTNNQGFLKDIFIPHSK